MGFNLDIREREKVTKENYSLNRVVFPLGAAARDPGDSNG